MRRDVDLNISAARPSAVSTMIVAAFTAIAGIAGPELQAGPSGPFGFSGNSGNDTLTVFDLSTGTAIYVIDLATLMIVDTVALGGVNPNSLAVAPEGQSGAIFADGFESGDISAW